MCFLFLIRRGRLVKNVSVKLHQIVDENSLNVTWKYSHFAFQYTFQNCFGLFEMSKTIEFVEILNPKTLLNISYDANSPQIHAAA